MNRREFTKAVKLAAWQRSQGRCEECTRKLFPGDIEYDHELPCGLGGDATLANCVVRCKSCHLAKTTKQDVPTIARARRKAAKNIGAHRPASTLPGSKSSRWKKRIDGTVVPRQ